MKKFFFAVIVFFAFVLSRTPSLAEPQLSPEEVCTKTFSEFSTKAFVTETVDKFGGLEQLLGKWKLAGLAGALMHVKIQFYVNQDQFYIRVNQDPEDLAWLCRAENSADTLRIVIPRPRDPKNGLILLRPTKNPNAISISGASSNWHYKGFKKIAN